MNGKIFCWFLGILSIFFFAFSAHTKDIHSFKWNGELDWGQSLPLLGDNGNTEEEWPEYQILDERFVEKKLVKIISEPENDRLHEIVLFVDEENSIHKVARRSADDQNVFTPDDLIRGEVVLAQAADRNAVMLSCPQCDPSRGGTLILKYLNNGVTNSYKNFSLELIKEGNEWNLYTQEEGPRVKVHTLRLRSRKVADFLIGIRKIEVNR